MISGAYERWKKARRSVLLAELRFVKRLQPLALYGTTTCRSLSGLWDVGTAGAFLLTCSIVHAIAIDKDLALSL